MSAVTIDDLTFRCRTGNHEGCTGKWIPDDDQDEIVVCSCDCHKV